MTGIGTPRSHNKIPRPMSSSLCLSNIVEIEMCQSNESSYIERESVLQCCKCAPAMEVASLFISLWNVTVLGVLGNLSS